MRLRQPFFALSVDPNDNQNQRWRAAPAADSGVGLLAMAASPWANPTVLRQGITLEGMEKAAVWSVSCRFPEWRCFTIL